jgi:PPOX class probable F420-dependent enzyme
VREEMKHMRTIGVRTSGKCQKIPASHRDLVECPAVAALTTVSPDGYPHTSVVWCDFDDGCIRVNTMRGFVKHRNMCRNARVTLLCYDPREPLRYLEVRGRVIDSTESGAGEHLDALASKYAGRQTRFFGGCVPARFAETEIPVIFRIQPIHVVAVDATRTGRTV